MTETLEIQPNVEQITQDMELSQIGAIRVCAYRPQFQLPVTLRPCEDASGRLYTGQGSTGHYESLTEEDKKKMPFVITRQTKVLLEHGKVLDPSNNIDVENWRWLRKHPYLALSQGEQGGDAVFYIENPRMKAKAEIDVTEKVDEFRYTIRKATIDKLVLVASAMGVPSPASLEKEVIIARLFAICNNNQMAGRALEMMMPENEKRLKATAFFRKAEEVGVIRKFRDGNYKYGSEDGIALGKSEEEVVDFMLSGENNELVRTIMDETSAKTD